MTLAFVFPIKDAWVVVADRLLTKNTGSPLLDGKEEKVRADNNPKIEELQKNLVFVGAGDTDLLERFIDELNSKDSLESFNKDFGRFSNDLSTTPLSTSINKTEFIIIDQRNLLATRYFEGKRYKIDEELKNSFLGTIEPLNLNDSKRDLLRMKDEDSLLDEHIYFLITNLEKLSVQRLECIGHPAVDGCNIWEIKKDKIRKIFVKPNKYSWRIL